MKKLFASLIFGLLVTGLAPFGVMDAYAIANPGDMYGSASGGTPRPPFVGTPTPGLILEIDQILGTQTPIGDPTGPEGVGGLAFDVMGRLFGTTITSGQSASNLIEVNPVDGSLIHTIGTITDDVTGTQLKINDLANQPGSNIMFGVTAGSSSVGGGLLYTIDTTNAVATLQGNTGLGFDETPISFAPDGTLYMTCVFCVGLVDPVGGNQLMTINPGNAAIVTNVLLSSGGFVGLGARSNEIIFGSVTSLGTFGIYTITTAGTTDFLGFGPERITDLAFVPDKMVVIGGELLPIDSTALLLASVKGISLWMIQVVLLAAGIGLVLVRRK